MKPIIKKFAPLVIFGGLALVAVIIRMNPPESPQRPAFGGPLMTVDAVPVLPVEYQINLQSYGTVQPQTQATLTAQVGGQIISVNPNVRNGGFFDKGDVLASIDARDYEADVRIAEAVLMDAKQTLAEAEARSNQAREDWARLGNEGEAPALVLREPQLQAARARIASAESTLAKAELSLERTNIIAPFAGRILRNHADVGQVVSNNAPVADVYSTDIVEIRLPLRNRDLGFIDLPETYRNSTTRSSASTVTIHSELIDTASWEARLVRTEGAIDETARQLHVVAQIDDPFDREGSQQAPLKIGQYVTASIAGKSIENAIVIPNNSIYQGTYVYVVEDGILRRRDVQIDWQNDVDAVIGEGLVAGDLLVTTPLGQVSSGIRVSVTGDMGGSRGNRPPGGAESRRPEGAGQ